MGWKFVSTLLCEFCLSKQIRNDNIVTIEWLNISWRPIASLSQCRHGTHSPRFKARLANLSHFPQTGRSQYSRLLCYRIWPPLTVEDSLIFVEQPPLFYRMYWWKFGIIGFYNFNINTVYTERQLAPIEFLPKLTFSVKFSWNKITCALDWN